VNALELRNELMLTASFAKTLAQLAAGLDDPELCDEQLLLELLSLADRAEKALDRLDA
jgi:hypothetical protein